MNVQGATALELNAQHVLVDMLEELVGPQEHVKDSSEHIIQVQSDEPGAVLEVLAVGKHAANEPGELRLCQVGEARREHLQQQIAQVLLVRRARRHRLVGWPPR